MLALLALLPTVNKVPDVGISWGIAVASLGSPYFDIGESARNSIFHFPFTGSIKLDFKVMLPTTK